MDISECQLHASPLPCASQMCHFTTVLPGSFIVPVTAEKQSPKEGSDPWKSGSSAQGRHIVQASCLYSWASDADIILLSMYMHSLIFCPFSLE